VICALRIGCDVHKFCLVSCFFLVSSLVCHVAFEFLDFDNVRAE
jgi:hypothetical protein